MNSNDPIWEHAVHLWLPAGTKGAISRQPLVQIAIYDKVRCLGTEIESIAANEAWPPKPFVGGSPDCDTPSD